MSKNFLKRTPKKNRQPVPQNKPEGPNNWLRKAIQPMDVLIGIAAIYIFYATDFDNLSTFDMIFLVTFAIWLVLTLARCVIYFRKS